MAAKIGRSFVIWSHLFSLVEIGSETGGAAAQCRLPVAAEVGSSIDGRIDGYAVDWMKVGNKKIRPPVRVPVPRRKFEANPGCDTTWSHLFSQEGIGIEMGGTAAQCGLPMASEIWP